MRSLRLWGGLLVVLAVATAIVAVAVGEVVLLLPTVLPLLATGAFLAWIAQGWDTKLEDAQEIHRWGRPATATVLAVTDERLGTTGTRTAKLVLDVRPANERPFKTTRVLELPGGRVPYAGSAVEVKFDPNARRRVVLI